MYDIIIIGAGIAGLTSAIYSLNANKKVLILEKSSYGGQIINSSLVDNYPGVPKTNGFDLATAIYNQVLDLGGNIKYEEVIQITKDKKVITSKETYQAKAIIIATGLISRRLKIENEDKYVGKGISYCATCDGNFYKGKDVMVVGGGNTAIEEANYLSNICHKVYLVHRRDEFRSNSTLLETIRNKSNIKIIYNSKINGLNGDVLLESVDLIDKDNHIQNIPISGLFIAIGKDPNNERFQDFLELTTNGYIKADDDCKTNIDGIFAAGDVRNKKLRQLVTAASDGAIAATEAVKYINSI